MYKNMIFAMVCCLAIAGCNESRDWGKIAVLTGEIIGSTPADAKVAAGAEKLKQNCALLQTIAVIGGAYAPERHQVAAQQAQAAINSACAAPTAQNVAQLAAIAADAYVAARAVRDATVRKGGV